MSYHPDGSNPGYPGPPPAYAPPGPPQQYGPPGGQQQYQSNQPAGAYPGLPPQGGGQYNTQPGAPKSAYGAPGTYGQSSLPPKSGMPPPAHTNNSGVLGSLGIGKGQSSTKGFFGSLRKEWDSAVNTFDRYTHSGVAAAELFYLRNVVQLISRNSGRAVQIVQAPTGHLTIDANGAEGPNTFNALWTVAMCCNYTVQIHNNFNYLAIENGQAILKYYAHPNVAGPETKLRIVSVDGQFVYLECYNDAKFHVGFDNNGILKSATATGRDVSSQFAVRLISGVPKH